MKKSAVKAVSLCLCGTLALGGAGARALASGGEAEAPAEPVRISNTTVSAALPSARDETVYVLAGAGGSVEKVIVSDWLKNAGGAAALSDDAKLDGVENVKGNESFTLSGGTRVWDAQGNDIYTQGTTDQAPPVDMTVRYTLDGKAITPEDLAGKSGRVTIRFDYANQEYQMMDVGGRQEKIYVPFAMLTAMVLDNGVFRNVEVSNGRIYNDGSRTAVIGVAFPGLQENLDVDAEKLEIPDYVEVAADVTGFALDSTFTLASSGVFGELDTGKLEGAEDLSASLDQLTGAMAQLMDGANRLYDGLDALAEKSGALSDGIGQLAEGAGELASGADALASGADRLRQGADSLSAGLNALDGNSAALNEGAKQVFDLLLASADRQLAAAGAALPAQLTAENYAAILDGVIAALPEEAAAPAVQLKASLDSYSQFCQGLQSYTAGVAQAAEGAGTLTGGAEQLKSGADRLSEGAAQLGGGAGALEKAVPALTEGAAQLRDGAKELSDGLKEFDREGVQKLADAVDGGLEGLSERLRATGDAARGYSSFSGASGGTGGQVKFIYRTAPVEIPA